MGYQATNDGWKLLHKQHVTSAETGPSAFQDARPSNMIDVRGIKGIRLAFLGDTANDTCDVDIYGVDAIKSPDAGTIQAYKSEDLGQFFATIGAGNATGQIRNGQTNLYADTVTWTAETIVTDLALYWNIDGVGPTIQVLSPTGDGYAEGLFGSTFGYTWFSIIISAQDTGDATNILYKLDRLQTR